MLDQLITGLDVNDTLKMIKQNKDAMKYVFSMSDKFVPTTDYMLEHTHGEFSEEGSNMKTREIDIFKYFTDYIEDIGFPGKMVFSWAHSAYLTWLTCEFDYLCIASPDGTGDDNTAATLSTLYKFITGTHTIPPCGLPKDITVKFKHHCDEKCRCRPTASTCDVSLTLPLHYTDYPDFNACMSTAFVEAHGFGLL